ncbi:MAG: carbonic anhydrase family protein [Nocardioides sp.]|nr:carbonic anhydrase family protein [Nocardioides sp.]
MKSRQQLAALLTACVALGACGSDGEPDQESDEAVHWTYAEAGDWGDLDEQYAACGTGKRQSPVDLAGAAEEDLVDPVLDYEPIELTVTDTEHSIQVGYDAGSTLTLDDTAYDLVQLHFHAPSEHTVDGQPAAAEIHLVHGGPDGSYVVLGVLVEEGAPGDAVDDVLGHLPEGPGDAAAGLTFDADALLPESLETYRYEGSLTTPPCTEAVTWLVLAEPVTWSAEQLALLTARYDDNARPTQPLHDRTLVLDRS